MHSQHFISYYFGIILHCRATCYLFDSNRHLNFFYTLFTVDNSTTGNILDKILCGDIPYLYIPRNGLVESYGNLFLKKLH